MYELIIIGGGMAGMTAAIYASRKRMNFLFITDQPGGQFLESGEVLNYPGFKKISGAEFEQIMEEQLKFNYIQMKCNVKCQRIEKIRNNFVVFTNKGNYETESIILATGARAQELNVPGENEYKNRGVTYCAICDGPIFLDREVAVIGGGNSALEAVDFLKNIAKRIHVINLTGEFTAHEYLIENIMKIPKINIIHNAKTIEILGDGKFVTGLKYKQFNEIKELKVEGIFVEIGRKPNTEFLSNVVELDEHNHIKIDHHCATNVPGIYAAGDCASGHEYQFVIAAGQGCLALLKVARYLARKNKTVK